MSLPAWLHPYLFSLVACLGLAAFADYDLYRERDSSIEQVRANTDLTEQKQASEHLATDPGARDGR